MISSVDVEAEDSSLNRQLSINRARRLPPRCTANLLDAPISTGATDPAGFGTLALRLLNESLARLTAPPWFHKLVAQPTVWPHSLDGS